MANIRINQLPETTTLNTTGSYFIVDGATATNKISFDNLSNIFNSNISISSSGTTGLLSSDDWNSFNSRITGGYADNVGITTLAAAKTYADGLVVGLWDDRGNYNASSNTFPSSGGSGSGGAILKGDIWTISVIGTLGGVAVSLGDTIRAIVDSPGQTPSNWATTEANLGYTPLSNILANGNIFVGNSSGIASPVQITGDASISNTGVLTVSSNFVTLTGPQNISNKTGNISQWTNNVGYITSTGVTTSLGYTPYSSTNPSNYLSSGGITWTIRTSAVDNNWTSVCFGNGIFVTVSTSGVGNKVMTSYDGTNWTSRTSAVDNNWQSVCYGNGLFVAVSFTGTGNRVMTSPDGITWTSRTSAADNNWQSVCYGNGLFVAVSNTGTGNRVMTSPDGINWTSRTSAANNTWTSVCYGNDLFVAVSNSGTGNRVMTSPDGITWTSRTSAVDNNWRSVCYGNGLFVAVSNSGVGNRVMTSPDGITWTSRTSAVDNSWLSICYGNGIFVAVCTGGTGNEVMTSYDGITWTSRTSAADNSWFGVCYGNGLFVAVSTSGTGNRVMTSGIQLESKYYDPIQNTFTSSRITNGLGYTPYSTTNPSGYITGITSTGITTALGYTPENITNKSTNPSLGLSDTAYPSQKAVKSYVDLSLPDVGTIWSEKPIDDNIGLGSVTNEVCYGNGLFVAVGEGMLIGSNYNFIWNSLDGIHWNRIYSEPTLLTLNSVCYGNGLFVAVGGDNVTTDIIYTSPDGVTWTSRTSPTTSNQWHRVCYGNNLFVAISWLGTNTQVMTSPDGITWTLRTNNTTNIQWKSIVYANNLFVAVASDATTHVMTSPDGINWTIRTSPYLGYSLSYGNNIFVSVGGANRLMTSPDGINWTSQNIGNSYNYYYVTFGNGLFITVGYNSSDNKNYFFTSPDGITWTNIYVSLSINIPINYLFFGNNSYISYMTTYIYYSVKTTTRLSNLENIAELITNKQQDLTASSIKYPSVNAVNAGLALKQDALGYTPEDQANKSINSSLGLSDTLYSSQKAVKSYVDTSAPRIGNYFTTQTTPNSNNWTSVCYGNGLYVAVSNNGTGNRVMTSPDGITWTSRSSAANNTWTSVCYGNSLYVAVSSTGTGNRVMTSPDGITWTSRTSAADNNWTSVCYGNSLYVAVSSTGTGNRVMTSPDGITWTSRTSATNNSWTSVCYSIEYNSFIAVSTSGTGNRVMTSPDGITWTLRTSAADNNWRSVTSGNGVVIAVSNTGTYRIMYSFDGGVTWSSGFYGSGITFNSITYNNDNSTFYAISSTTVFVISSLDPTLFYTVSTSTSNTWSSIVYGNNVLVAVSTSGTGNRSMISKSLIDRVNYIENNYLTINTVQNSTTVSAIASGINDYTITLTPALSSYTQGQQFEILFTSGNTGACTVDINGIGIKSLVKNSSQPLIGGEIYDGQIFIIAYDGVNFQLLGSGGNLSFSGITTALGYTPYSSTNPSNYLSSNGIDWTSRTSAADNSWVSVCYGNGLFVAVSATGTGNRVMTSPDGVNWTSRTSAANNNWYSVCFGNGLFVAVSNTGSGNRVMTSPDGITWTLRTSAADNNWNSVCYGNGLFVAVSASGTGNRVMTSPDGITWTSRTSASDNSWTSVCFGNGLFVAVSSPNLGNVLMTSPDGITWTSRSGFSKLWYSVCYGNGLFVAVCNNPTGNGVMTSPDGITWTLRTSASNNNWNSVCYGNGLFVAVSNNGTSSGGVMTSPDGITWTSRTSAVDNDWNSVCYGNGMFVTVSFSGIGNRVMSSGLQLESRYYDPIQNTFTSTRITNGLGYTPYSSTNPSGYITGYTLISSGITNALGYIPENSTNKSTGITLGTSDVLYPSQKAVKTYVDNTAALSLLLGSNASLTGSTDRIALISSTGQVYAGGTLSSGLKFNQVSLVSINGLSETSLLSGTINGSLTLLASTNATPDIINYAKWNLACLGKFTTAGTVGSIQFRYKWGSTTLADSTMKDMSSILSPSTAYKFEMYISPVVVSTGATGSIRVNGKAIFINTTTGVSYTVDIATNILNTNYDTTVNATIGLTLQQSVATGTLDVTDISQILIT